MYGVIIFYYVEVLQVTTDTLNSEQMYFRFNAKNEHMLYCMIVFYANVFFLIYNQAMLSVYQCKQVEEND